MQNKPFQLNELTSSFPEDVRVLLRVDFNVPLNAAGEISDTRRILSHLKTIQFLQQKRAKIILIAHLGDPNGKTQTNLSFKPLLGELSRLLLTPITLSTIDQYQPTNTLTLLENIRFHPEEETNDDGFSRLLAKLADVYVNDAFSVCHRAHASIIGVTKYLPSFAGLSLNAEVQNLSKVLLAPTHPVTLVIGGKKVSDKIGVIQHLLSKVDHVLVGGACANTFVAAKGADVRASYIEASMISQCNELLRSPDQSKIMLPSDFVEVDNAYVDIGSKTIEQYSDLCRSSNTIVWAGPLGKYEDARFNQGNLALLKSIAQKGKGISIVGGGDTLAALSSLSFLGAITFHSLGGGAMLQFVATENLPGIEVLIRA